MASLKDTKTEGNLKAAFAVTLIVPDDLLAISTGDQPPASAETEKAVSDDLKTTAHAPDFHPRQPDTLTTWLRLHSYAYLHLFCARTHLTHHRLPWEPATTTPPTRRYS